MAMEVERMMRARCDVDIDVNENGENVYHTIPYHDMQCGTIIDHEIHAGHP
jgi:hypothetical protein